MILSYYEATVPTEHFSAIAFSEYMFPAHTTYCTYDQNRKTMH